MQGSINTPIIFISYSWSSPQYILKVLDLANRLVSDGIHVKVDKWDLREGQDKYDFMEEMVKKDEIKKVLILCDQKYKEKADSRAGGVGIETQIITPSLYSEAKQEKFIPIVFEKDSEGNAYLPTYISSRVYIDLSKDEIFEKEYEKLVRNIFGKPEYKRPALGVPPLYITESDSTPVKTTGRLKALEYQANQFSSVNISGYLRDFLDFYIQNLTDFRLNKVSNDQQIVDSIERMRPLRDDFVNFLKIVLKREQKPDFEIFHDFWERLIPLQMRNSESTEWRDTDFDNFKFFEYELVLYFAALLIDYGEYDFLANFIHSTYFYRSNNFGDLHPRNISIFNRYARLLEGRNQRLSLNRISITADMVKQGAQRSDITFEKIRDADLSLCYLTYLDNYTDISNVWYPKCAIYGKPNGDDIDLFSKLVSKRHFDRVKTLFDLNTPTSLENKIGQLVRDPKRQLIQSESIFESIKQIEFVIPKNIASIA